MSTPKHLPPVGVDQSSLPEGMAAPVQDNDKGHNSTWWPSHKTVPGPGDDDASGGKRPWRSTASDEMENFKHVPVVGRLPWRLQYMIFSGVLLAALVALLYFANQSTKQGQVDQAAPAIRSALMAGTSAFDALAHGQVLPSDYAAKMAAGTKAANQAKGVVASQWNEMSALLEALPTYQADAQATVAASAAISAKLGQTLNAVAPLWRAAGEGGEWSSVDAVNLSQVLAQMQYVQDTATAIANGRSPVPDRLAQARQNIEQAFRVFAASPAATQNTPLTQAWRQAAAGFLDTRSAIDVVVGRAKTWNTLMGGADVFDSRQSMMLQALAVDPNATASAARAAQGVWISGSAIMLSLLFLVWIGWKQQRWHVLEAQASAEQLQAAVEQASHQLRRMSSGDLTVRLRPTHPALNMLGSAMNATVKNLQSLVINVIHTADETKSASSRAIDATGALVDKTRSHVSSLLENSNDILGISHAMQDISELSGQANTTAADTIDAISVGQEAVEDARARIQTIRNKAEEGANRSRRLKQSSNDISFAANLLNEVAEQMSVLSVQASLQATKAGEAGQGFRVVADGLKALSERSGEGARRVASLIEATVADVVAMEESMELVAQETDEGSRLSDVSLETTLTVSQRLYELQSLIEQINTISANQEKASTQLSARTQESVQEVEGTQEKATLAAEAVVVLSTTSQALAQSAQQFKV